MLSHTPASRDGRSPSSRRMPRRIMVVRTGRRARDRTTNRRDLAGSREGLAPIGAAARTAGRCGVEPGTRVAMVGGSVDSRSARDASPAECRPAKRTGAKTTGEAMDPKNKFAAEKVRQLQQSLDAVAPYEGTELSKQQAIRMLSPQILALRSKGYGWTAVAAMLSEHGVPVSVAALRTYLRRVREEAATAPPRTPPKRLGEARAGTRQPVRPDPLAPSPSPTGETPPARRPPQPAAVAASAIRPQHETAPGTRREPEPRRSAFEVKPDTDDL